MFNCVQLSFGRSPKFPYDDFDRLCHNRVTTMSLQIIFDRLYDSGVLFFNISAQSLVRDID